MRTSLPLVLVLAMVALSIFMTGLYAERALVAQWARTLLTLAMLVLFLFYSSSSAACFTFFNYATFDETTNTQWRFLKVCYDVFSYNS